MTPRKPYLRHAARLTLVLFMFAMSALAPAVEGQQKFLLYVGTYTDHGSKGIYVYRFDSDTGKLTSLGLASESTSPSFLAVDSSGRFLYAVNETEHYDSQPTGAVSAFAIDSTNGKLSLLNQVSSRGTDPAHITLDRSSNYALVANYTSGSVTVFPVLKDGRLGEAPSFSQHKGSSVNPERQQGPHAHAIVLSPISVSISCWSILSMRGRELWEAIRKSSEPIPAPGRGI